METVTTIPPYNPTPPPPAEPDPTASRAGLWTTEFWLTGVIQLLNGLVVSGIFPDSHWAVKVASLLGAGISAAWYVHSRQAVKQTLGAPPQVNLQTGAGALNMMQPPAPPLSPVPPGRPMTAKEAAQWYGPSENTLLSRTAPPRAIVPTPPPGQYRKPAKG